MDPLLERTIISEGDLVQARRFADFLLQAVSASTDIQSKLVQTAFTTALIVAYSRPFTGNKDRAGKITRLLPSSVCQDFTPAEEALHDQILRQRHQAFAHSDAREHEVKIYRVDEFDMPISRNPHVPLESAQVELVIGMIDKVLRRIADLKNSSA